MYKFEYKLNADVLLDYQMFMAMHDSKLNNRLVRLMITLLIPFIILLLFYESFITMFIIVILVFVFDILVIPKLYWKTIKNNILNEINKKNVIYNLIKVEINDDEIIIDYNNEQKKVQFTRVENIIFTSKGCFLIYDGNASLIIPLYAFNSEYADFVELLNKKRHLMKGKK